MLLDEKFQLFNGVFGASDEVLGSVESGVDFEKLIVSIYQQCRTPEQISFEFDALQKDLEAEIGASQNEAREKLLSNFDHEVVEKVRIQSHKVLGRFHEQLWAVTRFILADHARFDENQFSFELERNPFPEETIHPGPYPLGREVEDANLYRVGHPIARRVIERAMALDTPSAQVDFDYAASGKNIAILQPLLGESGYLVLTRISTLEKKLRKLRQEIFDVEDEIGARRDALVGGLRAKLGQKSATEVLFRIRWSLGAFRLRS